MLTIPVTSIHSHDLKNGSNGLPKHRTPFSVRPIMPPSGLSRSSTNFHSDCLPFKLNKEFVEKYRSMPEPFGFNGAGHIVYRRTYSRPIDDNDESKGQERWVDTVERVVNGTFRMQQRHIESTGLGWNPDKGQVLAQEMFHMIFQLKFVPPGRGLWAMGSALTEERALFAALNNCAFVSTDDMKNEPTRPFEFLADASMLGVGVGFDTKGAGTITIYEPAASSPMSPSNDEKHRYIIPDSREGWVEAMRLVLHGYFTGAAIPEFDFKLIRPAGVRIKGFGGHASGPKALEDLLKDLRKVLDVVVGQPISSRTIVDIMNLIGKCVVAGNVRR